MALSRRERELEAALAKAAAALNKFAKGVGKAGGAGLAGVGAGGAAAGGGQARTTLGAGFRSGLGGDKISAGVRSAGGAGAFAGKMLGRGVAGLAVGAAAVAANVAGAGLVSATQGGSFGAGAGRQVDRLIASIPVIGELSGKASSVRVADGTQASLNAQTNDLAALGAGLSPEDRAFLTSATVERQKNVELDRLANKAFVDEANSRDLTDVDMDRLKDLNKSFHLLGEAAGPDAHR